MSTELENFNKDLYELLKVRGYKPVPLDSQNNRVSVSQKSDVIEFEFKKDDKSYGKAWVTVDDAHNTIVYYDSEQQDSPNTPTPGVDYDDTWTGLLRQMKKWAQRRQMSFELKNKDCLGDDMKQREYYKMKEKLGESYHPMGKKASYNDAVPNVKIVLQHNRSLEEGEARFRNVAKIYLENADGERFLAPTTRPGVARVYARHIAEGGVPNDERWNHIKSICEDYSKMAGFVRATKNKQFNESVQPLINEGIGYYNNLRETLHNLTSRRGYNAYFESWTPTLMEDEFQEDVSDMFRSRDLDPRIESVMPILSRLHKPVTEMEEVDNLAEWADGIINEKLDMEEARAPHPLLKAANKNLTDLATGEVRRKEDSKKAAAKSEREYEKEKRKYEREANKKPSPDKIWQKIEHAISNYFPDGDPVDYLNPYMQKNNLTWDDITRACKKHGYKDLWDYWNTLAQDTENDAYGDWMATGGKNVRQRAPFMEDEVDKTIDKQGDDFKKWRKKNFNDKKTTDEIVKGSGTRTKYDLDEDLGPEQKRVGQLGPTEKVKNNNIGKLVGASESREFDDLKRLIDITKKL